MVYPTSEQNQLIDIVAELEAEEWNRADFLTRSFQIE